MEQTGQRILLVEDDPFLRKAAHAILRRHGFEVITATDGEEALAASKASLPDLVLLDLIMPKIQGFEVLRALKSDLATSSIPVIVISNLGQDSDIQQVMKDGAADYVIKSNLSLEELVQRVKTVLARTD